MLKQSALRDRLNPKRKGFGDDPFIVVPCPPQLSARTDLLILGSMSGLAQPRLTSDLAHGFSSPAKLTLLFWKLKNYQLSNCAWRKLHWR